LGLPGTALKPISRDLARAVTLASMNGKHQDFTAHLPVVAGMEERT